ncbi:hypothetical protein MMC25_004644 [Agyrium rufum]|nr:hypothetical protein [Agyrium rufum]
MASTIRTVGVVGTGVIGSSWAGLFLSKGLRVLVSDPAPGAREKLEMYLEKIWPDLERSGLTPGALKSNYSFVGPSLDDHLGEVDFVQENAPEKLELKRNLFASLDAKTRSDVIIASSSSGLPSSQFITKCTNSPGRILIGHPFNPPHLMPLIEIVPHPGTESKYTDQAFRFYQAMDRKPIVVKKETPGFVANRLQTAILNEAYSLVRRGIVTAEELDTTVTTGVGLRWSVTGPFMCNILGGGGGKDGFKHILEHLGPSSVAWTEDMNAHSFVQNEENIAQLDESVQEWLAHVNLEKLELERNLVLVNLIKEKKETTALT